MTSVNLSELSEQELTRKAKKQKNLIIALWFVIGFMMASAIYKIYHNGFSISVFTPLCFIPILMSTQEQYKDTRKEIQSREFQ